MSKINFTSLKQNRVRKYFDNGIEIYNLNKSEKDQVVEFFINCMDKKTNKLNISGEDIIAKLIPIYTNIYIDTSDKDLIREIIEEPSEILEEVVEIIEEMIKELSDKLLKNINKVSGLSKEDIESMVFYEEESEPMTEDEVKEFNRLKEKAIKNNIISKSTASYSKG